MKFVRWLGAFGSGSSLTEAATWETKQVERQVAAEPLHRGKSYISHAKIGLAIANPESTFARGWLYDAWTVIDGDGILKAKRRGYGKQRPYRDMNRFLSAYSRCVHTGHHAEAAFNAPLYDAVVVKLTASERGKRRAHRLAQQMGLPLQMI